MKLLLVIVAALCLVSVALGEKKLSPDDFKLERLPRLELAEHERGAVRVVKRQHHSVHPSQGLRSASSHGSHVEPEMVAGDEMRFTSRRKKGFGKFVRKTFKGVGKLIGGAVKGAGKLLGGATKALTGQRTSNIKAQDVEDCVACRYIWLQVELEVGNTQIEENIYDAFTQACIDAQKAPIFYPACEDMFDDIYGMIGDYMEGYTVNQVCEGAKMCR